MPTSAAPSIDLGAGQALDGGLLAKEGADTTHLTVGRRQGQRRRHDPDHQQPVRRALHRARHRHDAEQLHVELRSAAGQRAVDRAGQAGDHLDGADDGAARRPAGLCARPAGRPQIFPSALQALVNLIDHGMSLQEAVEAPRIWTEGPVLEVEHGIPDSVRQGLSDARPQAAGACRPWRAA